MQNLTMTRNVFLENPQGRTFADVVDDPDQPFDEVLVFFSDADRQRRMEEAEIHHDRSPLAGVVRELEAQPAVKRFLGEVHSHRSKRLRQAIGVVVRIIMEHRGWRKTGRKGSLGVRAAGTDSPFPPHNTGGLAFWFLRAERYERKEGMPYRTVRELCRELDSAGPQDSSVEKRGKSRVQRSSSNGSPRSATAKKTQQK